MARPHKHTNKYIFKDDYIELQILDENENILAIGKIDFEDYDFVSSHKWHRSDKNQNGYLASNTSEYTLLHTCLLGKIDGYVVDHENRDRTDCRRSNLRHVSEQLNSINKGKQSNNTSGHVGVSWEKSREKWEAYIKLNKKKKFLGYYDDIEDAVKARLKAEIEYFGFNVDRTNDCNTVFKKKNKRKSQ